MAVLMLDSINLVQGTDAWLEARLGKVTASCVHMAVARTKSGWGADRKRYMMRLLGERLTGVSAPQFVTKAMQDGTLREPEARLTYELIAGVDVVQVGFVDHPWIAMTDGSPDGLVGKNGLIEIKCPEAHTHFETLESETIASDYIKQIQWNLVCTQREWSDFISFNPEPHIPEPLRFWKKRVYRDDLADELEKDVPVFLAELAEKVENFRKKYNLAELKPEGELETVE